MEKFLNTLVVILGMIILSPFIAIMLVFFLMVFAWLFLAAIILAIAQCFGARLYVNKKDVRIGYIKFFRFYPIKK